MAALLVAERMLLQMMFGAGVSVAVQDPSYPVYVDSSVIMGMTHDFQQQGGRLRQHPVHGLPARERLLSRPVLGKRLTPNSSSVQCDKIGRFPQLHNRCLLRTQMCKLTCRCTQDPGTRQRERG